MRIWVKNVLDEGIYNLNLIFLEFNRKVANWEEFLSTVLFDYLLWNIKEKEEEKLSH